MGVHFPCEGAISGRCAGSPFDRLIKPEPVPGNTTILPDPSMSPLCQLFPKRPRWYWCPLFCGRGCSLPYRSGNLRHGADLSPLPPCLINTRSCQVVRLASIAWHFRCGVNIHGGIPHSMKHNLLFLDISPVPYFVSLVHEPPHPMCSNGLQGITP